MIGFPGFDLIAGGALGLGSAYMGYKGQQEANEANVQLGREQMAFQERMSGTAYQRAVSDLRSAELNPMLAYQQGGASSPPGALPQVQNKMASAVSSAQGVMDVVTKGASVENINADTVQKLSNAGVLDARKKNLEADFKRIFNEALGSEWTPRRMMAQMELSVYEQKRLEEHFRNNWPEVSKMLNEAKLLGLEIPGAINRAAAEASEFKKHVSPFLGDVGKMTSSAGDLSRANYWNQGLRGIRLGR